MSEPGVTIKMFLADGTPKGLRFVEKGNWTGLALSAPKSLYSAVRGRSEFDQPSVYVLSGPADDNPTRSRVYVGEADAARARLDSHVRHKDWWENFVLFTSKDGNLNKAHIKYLESRLVEIASRAKRSQIDNIKSPQAPQLSDADRADAERFLEDMLLIYPLLGIDAFEEPRATEQQISDRPKLRISGPGANATGRELAEGFIVYAGGTARGTTVQSLQGFMLDLRSELQSDGVLTPDGEDLRLAQDYLFRSPSTAAAVVLGRNANGRTEWRDETGRTLKQIQEAAIPEDEGSE